MADSKNLALQLLITAKDAASETLSKVGGKITDLAKTALAFVGIGVSMQGAVQSAADFEEQLGKVAVKGGYSADQMAELTKGVEAVAAQFGISGTEAARGMEVLAAAGLNAKDAIATLPQVLALAKMEGISLDDAATKLSDDLSIMGLGFDQAGRMADVLAKGANITTSSAASLSEALSKVGGQAKAAGMDLEQTVAALDLLHKNGIKGSEAGTALAAILTQLLNPTSTASAELNKLGISSRDLGEVLDALKAKGSASGTAILAFGETAGPGLRALIGEGKKGLDDYTSQLRDLNGDAIKAAQTLSGNFNSALKALSAAWETVSRQVAAPLLAPLTAGLRAFSAALSDASGILGGAFLAGMTLVGRSIAQMVTAIPAWVASLRAAATAMSVAELATVGLSRALAILAGPVGLIATAVVGFLLFRKGAEDSKPPLDALKGSVEQQADALKKLGDAQLEVTRLTLQKAIADQTIKVKELGDAALDTAGKVGQQVIVWDDWQKGAHRVTVGQEQVAEANAKVEASTQTLSELTQQYNALTAEQAKRSATAATATAPHVKSLQELSSAYTVALADAQTYEEKLAESIPGSEQAAFWAAKLAQAQQDASVAQAAYRQALIPTIQSQQQYAQSVTEAAVQLRPYQALVDSLRAKLEAQQKAQQDTAATAGDLKKAQELLAQQTDAYWQVVNRVQQSEKERPSVLLALKNSYEQQAREVERLNLAQDGSKTSSDKLAQANDRLAAISAQYSNAAQQEGISVELLGKKRASEAEATAAVTQAKLTQLRAAQQLAQAQDDESKAAQIGLDIAETELRQTHEIVAAKQGELQQAALVLAQKEREYELTKKTHPEQEAELVQLRQQIIVKKAAVDAAQADIEARERERKTAESMAQGLAVLIDGYRREAETLQNNIQTLNTITDARERSAKAALTVAQASGDQQQIDKAQAELNNTLIEGGYQRAQAAQLAAKGDQDRATQAALAAVADGKYTLAEMDAVNALQDRADASQKAASASYNEAIANEASIKAAQKAAEAQRHLTDDGGAFAAVLASQIQYWRDQTDALSKATKALFEFYAGFSSVDPRLGGKLFGGMSEEAAAAKSKIAELTTYIREMQDATILAASDISVMFADINAAGAAAQKSYYEQKLAAEGLESKLQDLGENGARSFGSIAAAQQFVTGQARAALGQFNLLNEQDLSNLRSAIDDANQKLRDMQSETQNATDYLDELNSQLARSKGDTTAADLLDLQLENRKKIAAIEENITKAQIEGNQKALAIYQEQLRVAQQIYEQDQKNIKAKAESSSSTTTTAPASTTSPSSNSGISTSAKTFKVEFVSGSKTLTATTTNDPSDFLNSLTTAQKVAIS